MDSTVYLGEVAVGPGHEAVFMPEIGTYFDQDVTKARETIRLVKQAGAKIIKGEVFHTPEIVLNDGFIYRYATLQGGKAERYRDIVARKVLPFCVWREVYGLCRDLGLPFVVSAYDLETVDFLVDIGAAGIKLATSNIVHVPLLRHAAKTGIPVLLDTGKCSFEEVAHAIDVVRQAGCQDLIINHAPDGHPATAEEHNLRIIETYQRAFNCPIGLACHYIGDEILYAAVGLGYNLLEKPVCADPEAHDVDCAWALALSDMPKVIRRVRSCANALGKPYRDQRYTDTDHPARMGLVAKHDLPLGARLSLESVRFAWPCRGISGRDWDRVVDAEVVVPVEAGAPITWAHVKINSTT